MLFLVEQGIEESVELDAPLGRETEEFHGRIKDACEVRVRNMEGSIDSLSATTTFFA
jgi:hypothetical protein